MLSIDGVRDGLLALFVMWRYLIMPFSILIFRFVISSFIAHDYMFYVLLTLKRLVEIFCILSSCYQNVLD